MSFNDYIERNVFAPLNMKHSSFRQPLPDALKADMAVGYEESGKPGHGFEVVNVPPAGSLSSTGDDMAHFMIAHLADGKYGDAQILKPETARMMHTTITRPFPDLNGIALGFYQANINGHRVIAHGGDLNYFHSDLWLFLDDHVGVFISVNALGKDGLGEGIRDDVFHEFADRYFPQPEPVRAARRGDRQGARAADRGPLPDHAPRRDHVPVADQHDPADRPSPPTPTARITTKLLLAARRPSSRPSPYLWHEVGGHDLLAGQGGRRQGRDAGAPTTWRSRSRYEPLHGLAGAGLEVPLLRAVAGAAAGRPCSRGRSARPRASGTARRRSRRAVRVGTRWIGDRGDRRAGGGDRVGRRCSPSSRPAHHAAPRPLAARRAGAVARRLRRRLARGRVEPRAARARAGPARLDDVGGACSSRPSRCCCAVALAYHLLNFSAGY